MKLEKITPTDVVDKRWGQAGSYRKHWAIPAHRVISGNRQAEKILMIKDSYGNAMAPFLALHYQGFMWLITASFDSNIIDFQRKARTICYFYCGNDCERLNYTASREAEFDATRKIWAINFAWRLRWEPWFLNRTRNFF